MQSKATGDLIIQPLLLKKSKFYLKGKSKGCRKGKEEREIKKEDS